MSISTTINKVQYAGNGVATEFTVSFPFNDEEDLEVTLTGTDGAETTLTLGTDYTVSGAGKSAGTVAYPVSGDPLASGETLTIRRVMPLVQALELVQGGGYSSAVIEAQFDKLIMIAQQHQEEIDRKVGVAVDRGGPGGLPERLPGGGRGRGAVCRHVLDRGLERGDKRKPGHDPEECGSGLGRSRGDLGDERGLVCGDSGKIRRYLFDRGLERFDKREPGDNPEDRGRNLGRSGCRFGDERCRERHCSRGLGDGRRSLGNQFGGV